MSETQATTRLKTRFDVSSEQSEDMHCSQHLNSRDRSASVEDRDVLHKVDMQTNIGHSSSSSLPKLKLNSFHENPLEWPEWSSMFMATVDNRTIPDSVKNKQFETLLIGKAKSAISGMEYSGQFYSTA